MTNQELAKTIREIAERDTLSKLDAAHNELSEMCERQWHGQPAINWRIPAEKQDSDLVIGDALSAAMEDLANFRNHATRLAEALERLEAAESLLSWLANDAEWMGSEVEGKLVPYLTAGTKETL